LHCLPPFEDFDYTPDGTRTQDGTRTYDVDALGRIVKMFDRAGVGTLAISYDAFGRPLQLDYGMNPATQLNYFGMELVQETSSGSAVRQYTNRPMLGRIATHVSGESWQHLYDARQNNITTLDHNGNIADTWRYDDFGFPNHTAGGTPSGVEPIFGGMRYLNFTGTSSSFGTPPNWPEVSELGQS
jgi:hypothetical protein